MKKRSFLLVATLVLSLFLAACSAKSGGDAPADYGGMPSPSAMPSPMPSTAPMAPAERGETFTLSGIKTPASALAKENKLIFRADLSIQSTEFDKAVAALDKLVTERGGYYERNEIQQGGYYDARASRYGSFTVRVPQAQFEAFLSAAGTVGHVVSSSKSSEDIGEAYYDTEARLKTQQIKHERLLSLLEKADNMENIIALENALADVEYQIEQLTGTLRKYDSLVGYSTITINLSEVLKITDEPKETASLGGRVSNAFSIGARNFGQGLENMAVWAAYNFIGVLIFLALATVAVVIIVKQTRKRKGTLAPPIASTSENKTEQ